MLPSERQVKHGKRDLLDDSGDNQTSGLTLSDAPLDDRPGLSSFPEEVTGRPTGSVTGTVIAVSSRLLSSG